MNNSDFDFGKFFRTKMLKIIFVIIIVIIIFVILITGGNVLWFRTIMNWIVVRVHVITGWDIELSRAIAALITGLVLIIPLWKLIWSVSPFPMDSKDNKGKKVWYRSKNFYRLSLFVGISIIFLFSYLGSKDVYFNPLTGEGEKYVSIRPNGEAYISNSSGYDPVTGVKLVKITNDLSLKINGIVDENKSDYFDRETGEARIYYSLRPYGQYFTSLKPGYDPMTGDKLQKITKDVALKIDQMMNQTQPVHEAYIVESKPEFLPNRIDTKVENSPRPSSKMNSESIPSDIVEQISKSTRESTAELLKSQKQSKNLAPAINTSKKESGNKINTIYDARDIRCIVNFSNNSPNSIIIFNDHGKELFTVHPSKKGVARLQPGDYFFVKNGSTNRTVFHVENKQNVYIEFSDNDVKAGYILH